MWLPKQTIIVVILVVQGRVICSEIETVVSINWTRCLGSNNTITTSIRFER